LSSIPGKDHPPYLFHGEDKVAHLVLYAVLGVALAWGRSRRHPSAPHPATLWGVGFLYGVSDELHQAFTPGRDVSLGDLAADAVGVALGYWIFTLLFVPRALRADAPPS
jgi:VanZ family protein